MLGNNKEALRAAMTEIWGFAPSEKTGNTKWMKQRLLEG